MRTTKASKPQRVKKKPLPKVSKPEPLNDTDVAKRTVIEARAHIGLDPEFVTTVGLGKLKVTTANGLKNDGNTDV
jgi:hypothetical protein